MPWTLGLQFLRPSGPRAAGGLSSRHCACAHPQIRIPFVGKAHLLLLPMEGIQGRGVAKSGQVGPGEQVGARRHLWHFCQKLGVALLLQLGLQKPPQEHFTVMRRRGWHMQMDVHPAWGKG